ncbi:hypothetical protein NBM05_08500 [Rothia sp. AR01]|uniref:Uncharacterized protein n=1 Tax=Rothia santali TaxID=2949643 RepID=A0A9X2KLD8_9MICC|nr:hypothetical protein [Rothia santali]MCP3426041.1 hypothetical protein [Rothia santali]
MYEDTVRLSQEHSENFAYIAHGARVTWKAMSLCGDPAELSNFSQIDSIYPFEKVSSSAKHYISAALEHLLMWADYAAPQKFHPEQETVLTSRPVHALARASLESSAQAVWLLNTVDIKECLRRHISLFRWNLGEYKKSNNDPEHKKRLKDWDAAVVKRVSACFEEREISPPGGYMNVIRWACEPEDLALEWKNVERIWRAASGAAHGMPWTNFELMDVSVGEEYEEGQYRTTLYPDPELMFEVLEAGYQMTQYAAMKYMFNCGANIEELLRQATMWLANHITYKEGANLETIERLRSGRVGQTSNGER